MKFDKRMSMAEKRAKIDARIMRLEQDLLKARQYLEDGSHADWQGFRPLFKDKNKAGKMVPPHPSWVKNVFIPAREKAMRNAEKILHGLE